MSAVRGGFKSFHPAVNFIYFAAVVLFAMFSMHPVFLALSFCSSFAYSVYLGGWGALKFNLFAMVPIVLLMAVINPLFSHQGVTVLFFLNGNPMTLESIVYGLAASVMLVSVIGWFSCYNRIMTSDKFIYLFGRVLPSLSLVLSMCFRFVPLFKEQFKEISDAQKAVGRDVSQGGLFKRARQFLREVSILVTWSMENSIETSDSMRARGYGLRGRSSFSLFRFDRRDGLMLGFVLLLTALVAVGCFQGQNNIYYYPAIVIHPPTLWSAVSSIAYGLLLFLPLAIDLGENYSWKSFVSKM